MEANTDRRSAFDIATPRDMLAKLKRELKRVANASFLRDELVDHGTNCALTAWQITDWVWRVRFVDDRTAQDALAASYAVLRTKRGRPIDRFKECVTRACPELALCQDIANGFKHVVAMPPDDRQAAGVKDVTASASMAASGPFKFGDGFGSAGLGGPGYVAGGEMFRLKIRSDDGENLDAIGVFDAVVAYWTRFMDDHGIK